MAILQSHQLHQIYFLTEYETRIKLLSYPPNKSFELRKSLANFKTPAKR